MGNRATLLERISHPERVMFPAVGVTKLQVAEHYLAVADRILPHLDHRPVSFVRAPEGIEGETFFQRHGLSGMKRGIVSIEDPQKRHAKYIGIDGVDGLVTAAQFGVIELHGWMARTPNLGAPDRMVFDFDPDEGLGFDAVKDAAEAIRGVLESAGLKSYPLASGGKGLHVVVPLDGSQSFDDLGDFSGGIAKGLARADPKRFVAVMSKERRKGRIFIDWLRNRPYSTAILPWSLRARPGASVAVPLTWAEVPKLTAANQFGIAQAAKRRDVWEDFWTIRQRMEPEAIAHLKRSLGK
jgi:bifunctional non-homologous end joining protein LigD